MSAAWRIDRYDVYPVQAGRFRLDGGAMFGVVPKVLWSKAHPADELNRIELVSRCLLIAGEGRLVLVDTGIGQSWGGKERSIYAVADEPRLEDSLRALGCRAHDVTHVIHTHLHFDHVSGGVVDRGRGLVPLFPRAQYIVQQGQLQWAQGPTERDRASYRPETWECLRRSGQLHLVEGEQELLPGVFVHLVHGHTPFQQLVRIGEGASSLLYCSDLVPLASQVRVPWLMAYDLNAVKTQEEKRALLGRAADEGWRLFLEHDPRVTLCRVRRMDKGLEAEWQAE